MTRCSLSVMLNDTVEGNFHFMPEHPSTIPDKEIGVSTKRHVNNLNLPDHTLNVPNKVDLLLGADV